MCSSDLNNGEYSQTAGLIEKAKDKNKELALFITSALNTKQWYCLLSKCQNNDVKLKLHMAPGVNLPEGLRQEDMVNTHSIEEPHPQLKPSIYLTNSSEKALEELGYTSENAKIIDVEDYTYQDLIYAIDFNTANGEFKDFKVKKSPLLEKLINGEPVILKGEFSEQLCRYLEPILVQKKLELPDGTVDLPGKLILMVENQDKSLFQHLPEAALVELPPFLVKARDVEEIHEPEPDYKSDLALLKDGGIAKIKENSADFMEARKKMLLDALDNNNIVQLVGESGVGKSKLLKWLQENQNKVSNYAIFNELNSTSEWLKSDNNNAILFIDEANIEDKHLTTFNALNHPGREILHDGTLSTPSRGHKLVTAKNPDGYGGGRNAQKLFADGSSVEIHLKDFPISYLYTSILLPIYQDAVDKGMIDKESISEELFAKDCVNYLESYVEKNRKAKDNPQEHLGLTARELQEYALKYCLNQNKTQNKVPRTSYDSTEKFVPTKSNAQARVVLDGFIDVRRSEERRVGKECRYRWWPYH